MPVISSLVNSESAYKVLLLDSATHTPAKDDKYYIKLDATSSTGFSAYYNVAEITDLTEYFTGWLIKSITEETKTFGYIRMALPPRYLVEISSDQEGAEITATTATGL